MLPGDVVIIDFGIPIGSTPAKVRPAIVLTAELVLETYSTTMHVVPVTSNITRNWLSDVNLAGPGFLVPSAAQCHLCSVIDRLQIVEETGHNVGAVLLAQIRSVVADLLDTMPT
jgi:mRNA-degrading endonuclease toxin of MazEF toxin-antitoxin module